MRVPGQGDPSSKLWLIGEAPGEQESIQGKPFVGGAGIVLNGILSKTGIKRSECYIDNVIQDRPPANDFGVYYEDKRRLKPKPELLAAHNRLHNLIREYRPNLIVPLGGEALYAITGKKEILHWRGSTLKFYDTKVIPTVHPALVMRQYDWHPIAVMDFYKIKEEAKFPEIKNPYNDNFKINPSYEEIMYYLTEFLPKQEYIAFDIETVPEQKLIQCIGFGWSIDQAICIPFSYGESSYWNLEEEIEIIKKIKELMSNPNIKFIAQNAQYDMTWIYDKWGIKVDLWFDTMIGFHCLYSELKKSLAFLCSIYTKRPYYKNPEANPDSLWTYNCLDCVVTWECAFEIIKDMKEFDTYDFYRNHSHQLINPLMSMQSKGILIDTETRNKLRENLNSDIVEMERRLVTAVGYDLNANSPKQVKEFLYNDLKLPPQKKRSTGTVTADEDAIQYLYERFPNPALMLIIDIRQARKLLSTYVDAEIDADNRLRCSYLITGTVTGRLSSRSNVYGTGTNLQNIPRGKTVKCMMIPDPGYMLVNADLSQAEARIVAYICGDRGLIELFESGGDIHRRNASLIFQLPENQITKELRQIGKTIRHASNYGARGKKLAETINTDLAKSKAKFGKTGLEGHNIKFNEEYCNTLLYRDQARYPGLKVWHKLVESEVSTKKILRTPFGRKRMFFDRFSPSLINEAIAYVPQATCSDIMNMGIARAWRGLPENWQMLLQVHDSVLLQVPIGTAPEHIWKFIKHHFEIPLVINERRFTIPVDIEIGERYSEMTKLKVQGMGE